MIRTAASIWLYEPAKAKMTKDDLRAFAVRLRPKRKILVFRTGDFPEHLKQEISKYTRFKLIEVVHIATIQPFYTDEDFRLAIETTRLGTVLTEKFIPAFLKQINVPLDSNDVDNISAALQLRISDRLYVRLRLILPILKASNVAFDAVWEDYQKWAFKYVAANDSWWLKRRRRTPIEVTLFSAEQPLCDDIALDCGFGELPENMPETLLFGSAAREAYLKSADMICEAEERLGKNVAAIIPMQPVEIPDNIKSNTKLMQAFLQFSFSAPELKLHKLGFLKLSSQSNKPKKYVYGTLKSGDPEFTSEFSFHPDMWIALLANECCAITNVSFKRVVAFYLAIMRNPKFANVSTAIFSPSRSEFFTPAVLGLKQRGVHTIEYQPLFWSDHPRYEVRDMDLFMCSDNATKQVVERKYEISAHHAKVVMGPFFAMDQFVREYASALSEHGPREESDLVGLALQPENLPVFKEACALLVQAGKRVLIRPHPVQILSDMKDRFGEFGEIDEGRLEDFVARSSVVVTGFSNVAVQAATVGKPAVCLPLPNTIGLNIADASARILVCDTMDNLIDFVDQPSSQGELPIRENSIDHWCNVRRAEDPGL